MVKYSIKLEENINKLNDENGIPILVSCESGCENLVK